MALKKLLALDQGEYIGGAELFFSDLLTRMSADFEIHLITADNNAYQKRYKNSSVVLHELPIPALKPIGLKTYQKYKSAQKSIEKIVDDIEPDYIVSNTVRTHLLVSALAKKKHTPLYWMAHDQTFPKLFLKWFKNYPQKIISCSGFVEGYYKEIIGHSAQIQYEILYPFGLQEDKIESLKNISKQNIIGTVGKFIPWKGQDIFIEVVREIHQKHPDYRFEMIASKYKNNEESHQFYERCLNLIEEYDLKKVLTIKENITDVLPEIARWEILVHCSIAPEPLGRVILEGKAAGCAVVASNLGGPKEVIKDGTDGFIRPPEQEQLVKILEQLLEDRKLMKTLAERAQNEIKDRYIWSKVIQKFESLFK